MSVTTPGDGDAAAAHSTAGRSSPVRVQPVADIAADAITPTDGRPADLDLTVPAPGGTTPEASSSAAALTTEPAPVPPAEPAPPVLMASFQEQALFLPSPHAIMVGFHEASYGNALGLRTHGMPLKNDNLPKQANPTEAAAAPNYVIMGSRGRPTRATSAIDVAMPHDATVLSPVTGTVIDVRRYDLYGRYPDLRVEIVPDDRPDLVVTMLHVTGRMVEPGARVEAGVTPIAHHANLFPFRSHVDAYAGSGHPHVHLEVKLRGS